MELLKFVTLKQNYLDYLNYGIFIYGPSIILSIIYLAGRTHIGLLGLGYLIAYIFFLWFGQDFTTKYNMVIIRLWNYFIYYCCMVICIKVFLQIVVCDFHNELISCKSTSSWLWSIFCTIIQRFLPCSKLELKSNTCYAFSADVYERFDRILVDADFSTDGICMIVLLLQKQMFNSHYWKDMVTELRSQVKFASQAASLFDEISQKKVEDNRQNDEQILSRIIQNLDRIKEQRLKLKQVNNKQTSTYVESFGHYEAIRSGDYHMFSYEFDEEVDKEPNDEPTAVQEQILSMSTSTDQKPPATDNTDKEKSTLNKMYLILVEIVDYFIDLLNKKSHDYREVSSKLIEIKSKDKIIEQKNTGNESKDKIIEQKNTGNESNAELEISLYMDEIADDNHSHTHENLSQSEPIDLSKGSRIYRLFDASFYFVISQSEIICYLAMIIYHLISDTVLTLLLPLSIFFRTTLSRPSSNFYFTIVIIYVQIIIVVKHVPLWKFVESDPSLENMSVSLLRKIYTNILQGNIIVMADLFLISSLFLHRSILKQYGLWNSRKSTSKIQQKLLARDVYTPMVFCDLLNIILVIICYNQFDEHVGLNFIERIKQNRIPFYLLMITLIQLIFIIIDRIIYLRRALLTKFIFQIIQILVIHIWLLDLSDINERKFENNFAIKLWYLLKCIYFYYSSIQIRSEYPTHISGNFLMKHFDLISEYLYRIYTSIPFLFELRTLMNWIFTDTSLGVTNWLQLEDIYSNTYLVKCARYSEKNDPIKRGKIQTKTKKGFFCLVLIILILLILSPLIIFTIASSLHEPNTPKKIDIQLTIGDHLSIYQMTAQDRDLIPFTRADYHHLQSLIYWSKSSPEIKAEAKKFVYKFNQNDIVCANFFSKSINKWKLNEATLDYINHLQTNGTIPVKFAYTITRSGPNDIATTLTHGYTINLELKLFIKTQELEIKNLIPRFTHIATKAKPQDIHLFEKIFPFEYYTKIKMVLNAAYEKRLTSDQTEYWWKILEDRTKLTFSPSCSYSDPYYITMFFFNDQASPNKTSFLDRYGIIGLYTTFIIVIARFLRSIFQTSQKIMFNELPNVEPVWQLLQDIDFVREHKKFQMEEELFAQIIFLHRSPETLIRFTKLKLD